MDEKRDKTIQDVTIYNFLGAENDQDKITLNTLLDELKELKEIILNKKEGDLKLKDNQ